MTPIRPPGKPRAIRSSRRPWQIVTTASAPAITRFSSVRVRRYLTEPSRPGAVADRGVLPEGADLVDQRQAVAARGAQRGEAAQRRRMGVEHVGPPLLDERADRVGQRGDLAPFARQAGHAAGAVEGEAFGLLDGGSVGVVPQAGDRLDLEPVGLLRLEDRPRAEGVAAVQRQRVVEDVKNPEHRGKYCHEQP